MIKIPKLIFNSANTYSQNLFMIEMLHSCSTLSITGLSLLVIQAMVHLAVRLIWLLVKKRWILLCWRVERRTVKLIMVMKVIMGMSWWRHERGVSLSPPARSQGRGGVCSHVQNMLMLLVEVFNLLAHLPVHVIRQILTEHLLKDGHLLIQQFATFRQLFVLAW